MDFAVRRGFGLKGDVRPLLLADYHSELVERARREGGTLNVGRFTFRLAQEFGFCYGVNFALNLIYEARSMYPDRRIFLLSELLHNPFIAQRLGEMRIELLPPPAAGADRFASVAAEDVVVVPAFGASVGEYEALRGRGCVVVDTTCSSVMAVWRRVERYAQEGFTAVIHGDPEHEETRGTKSRTGLHRGGKHLVVRDADEAAYVCRYIEEGGDADEFRARFGRASSPDFDPDTDLGRVGLANQTTMLSNDSLAIANMFMRAVARRYGSDSLTERFRHFDTICTATQKRQDAVTALAAEEVDLIIVVGGYNSSNTTHLSEISSLSKPTYHINSADCIVSPTCIQHLAPGSRAEVLSDNWLPEGEVTVGLTAGASTPGRVVGEVIDRIINRCGPGASGAQPLPA